MPKTTLKKTLKRGGKSESVTLLYREGTPVIKKVYDLNDASHRQGFEHETKILRRLEQLGCSFVPRLLSVTAKNHQGVMYMTYCGPQTPNTGSHRAAIRSLIKKLGREYHLYRFQHKEKTTNSIHPKNSCWDGKQYSLIDFGSSLWRFRKPKEK